MIQDVESNFVTDVRIVPPSYTMKHYHEHIYHELLFVIDGTCSLQVIPQRKETSDQLQSYKLTTGSITIIPAGTPHKTIYLSGRDHERAIIYFNDEELLWIMQELGDHAADQLISGLILQIPKKKISYLSEIIHKICFEHKGIDYMSTAYIRTYFHEIILFMLRCCTYKENVIPKMDITNQQIQNIIEYMIANFQNDITLANTAERFHMSESSLSKKFKAFTDRRFKEYLIDIRTRSAADALIHSSDSITLIAQRCGFSDSNTFGDTFKRIYGVSPTEYRKRTL